MAATRTVETTTRTEIATRTGIGTVTTETGIVVEITVGRQASASITNILTGDM
jgi:hypothetical protein